MNGVMKELSTLNCPHFGTCSGCSLAQNMNHPPIWQEIKKYFNTKIDLEIGLMQGWRTKAKLAIRGTSDKPLIGLFQSGSHNVQVMACCSAHHPSINHAVALLEEAIGLEKISIYNEKEGLLRYAQFLVDLETNLVQLVLVVREKNNALHRLADRLLRMNGWHSIWFNVQNRQTNRIFGDEWIHYCGDLYLTQRLGLKPFLFHPASFAQAHWTLFQRLALDVAKQVPIGSKLVELYAGIGVMGCLAAPHCKSVQLVENNPFSYASFLASQQLSHVTYHLEDAGTSAAKLEGTDCILVDPPRKGVDPLLLQALEKHSGKLIYVSCDFASFQRDSDQLQANNWELKGGKGYLLFPGTNHVEIVALFEK